MAMTVATKGGSPPPRLRGALPVIGHLHQLRRDPIGLMKRVVEQCGPVGEFRIGSKRVVLLSGEDAQEAFFRAPDEQLDQGAAYPFMTPVFGRGVVFDAPVENRSAALGNTALRDNQMRGHAQTITREVDRMVAGWDGSGGSGGAGGSIGGAPPPSLSPRGGSRFPSFVSAKGLFLAD